MAPNCTLTLSCSLTVGSDGYHSYTFVQPSQTSYQLTVALNGLQLTSLTGLRTFGGPKGEGMEGGWRTQPCLAQHSTVIRAVADILRSDDSGLHRSFEGYWLLRNKCTTL